MSNLMTFIEKACRTESLNTDIEHWSYHVPRQIYRMMHAAIGLCTEYGEWFGAKDAVNCDEEIADAWWYMAIAISVANEHPQSVLGISRTEFDNILIVAESLYTEESLIIGASEMLDACKRVLYYRAPLEGKQHIILREGFNKALNALYSMSEHRGPQYYWDMVIAKLAKRYPDKFTTEDALSRDLVGERKILESHSS